MGPFKLKVAIKPVGSRNGNRLGMIEAETTPAKLSATVNAIHLRVPMRSIFEANLNPMWVPPGFWPTNSKVEAKAMLFCASDWSVARLPLCPDERLIWLIESHMGTRLAMRAG